MSVEQRDTLASGLHDALRLALVSGIGPKHRKALLAYFGDATAVLSAAPAALRAVPGIGPKLSAAVSQARREVDAEDEVEFCRRHGIEILLESDEKYPQRLKEIVDPPGVLFVQGTIAAADSLAIAIVGSRHATHYGLTQAERLAGSLARAGLTVISGLARGIDGAAHRGALAAGGRTLAVLGSGLANIYPPEHRELAKSVAGQGAVLSEAPPRAAPLSGSFPQRNRLISGLSIGVLVVEASVNSGALITARHALEQGREVFAVPGPVDSRTSHGCHRLIRDGAKLVQTADDILESLGPLPTPTSLPSGEVLHHPGELLLNELERAVLAGIGSSPITIDQVITTSGLTAPQVLSTLSVLEMRRIVRRISGNLVCRP